MLLQKLFSLNSEHLSIVRLAVLTVIVSKFYLFCHRSGFTINNRAQNLFVTGEPELEAGGLWGPGFPLVTM